MGKKRKMRSSGQLPVGVRLRDVRNAVGLTQRQLAAKLKVSQAALSHLENQDDLLVSTLSEYINALGATLRIEADIPSALLSLESQNSLQSLFKRADEENQLSFHIIPDEPFPPQRDVVFSIRPSYASKILSGEKTVELRRRFPVDTPPGTGVLIYETSPTKAIVGDAKILGVVKTDPMTIWSRFHKEACIEKSAFDEYFAGCETGVAISLSDARPLEKAVELDILRTKFNFEPPQSFLYAGKLLRQSLRNDLN